MQTYHTFSSINIFVWHEKNSNCNFPKIRLKRLKDGSKPRMIKQSNLRDSTWTDEIQPNLIR